MKKSILSVLFAGAILGVVSTFAMADQQPTTAYKLCRQYEEQTDQVCEKAIVTDWDNQLGIIQSNDSVVFMRLNDKGEWEIPSSNFLLDGLDQAVIYWTATSDQKNFDVFGIASSDVKHIRMVSPATYDLTVIRQEGFSIFYTPLTEPDHMYRVNIQGFDDQGQLIYGDPIEE